MSPLSQSKEKVTMATTTNSLILQPQKKTGIFQSRRKLQDVSSRHSQMDYSIQRTSDATRDR
jgi:hypothetical protein